MPWSTSERGLGRRHAQEFFLRVTAYRACHEGRLPPINSELWREYARLQRSGGYRDAPVGPRPRRWFWQRRPDPDRERQRARPLSAFRIEKPFLTDDFSVEAVEARLSAWPMVTAFGMTDRHPMGEWFIYCIEVLAEDLRQAKSIVECICALPCLAEGPGRG